MSPKDEVTQVVPTSAEGFFRTRPTEGKNVDGPDEPGHDDGKLQRSPMPSLRGVKRHPSRGLQCFQVNCWVWRGKMQSRTYALCQFPDSSSLSIRKTFVAENVLHATSVNRHRRSVNRHHWAHSFLRPCRQLVHSPLDPWRQRVRSLLRRPTIASHVGELRRSSRYYSLC